MISPEGFQTPGPRAKVPRESLTAHRRRATDFCWNSYWMTGDGFKSCACPGGTKHPRGSKTGQGEAVVGPGLL